MNNNKIELLKHQQDMVTVSQSETELKGIMLSPTGTGKTFTQAEIIAKEVETGGFKIIIAKTPRILLSNQVGNEINTYIQEQRHESAGPVIDPNSYVSFFVHSGANKSEVSDDCAEMSDAEIHAMLNRSLKESPTKAGQHNKIVSKNDAIIKAINDAKAADKPIVFTTTYHSVLRKIIGNIDKSDCNATLADISLDLNDECHYLTRDDFNDIVNGSDSYYANKQFFFTATFVGNFITKDDNYASCSMSNEDVFGKVLFRLTPDEAIARGLIVAPDAEILTVEEDARVSADTEIKGMTSLIRKSIDNLIKTTKLQPKLLVACKGTAQLEAFINSSDIRELVDEYSTSYVDMHILTVMSDESCITHNGVQITRDQFEELKDEYGNQNFTRLIIVHYDILSEGIDVPGLTGVLILRNMKRAKFFQTIGRALRVYKSDRSLVDKKAERQNTKKWLKPVGKVFFPDVCEDSSDIKIDFTKFLLLMYIKGYSPWQGFHKKVSKGMGTGGGDELPPLPPEDEPENNTELELIVERLFKGNRHAQARKELKDCLEAEIGVEAVKQLDDDKFKF